MNAARVMDTKTADKVIVNEWNNTQQYWMSLNMIGGTIEIEGVNRPTATLKAVSSGSSRPDATLRRERNHCELPSASLIEPPSSAMDE